MKLAIAVSTPEVKQNPMGITGHNFSQVLKDCARLGYHGVELMPQRPSVVQIESLTKEIAKLGLEVPVIGTGLIFGIDRLSLLSPIRQESTEAMQRVKLCIKWAADLGAMVSLGGVRGRLSKLDSSSLSVAQAILGELCDYAATHQVKLILEPINRYENNFLNTAQEVRAFLKQLGSSACGVLLDLFHANIEEASIEQAVLETESLLWHIHISDSNRWPPAYGHINFSSVVRALKHIGYQGYLSAELLPRPNESVAMAQTAQVLLPLIHSVAINRDLPPCLAE